MAKNIFNYSLEGLCVVFQTSGALLKYIGGHDYYTYIYYCDYLV